MSATASASTGGGASAGPFAVGATSTYDLHWRGMSAVQLPGATDTIDVDVDLQGTLVARALASRGDETDVELRISDVRAYDILMKGKSMFDATTAPTEKAALMRASVLVTMDAQGKIKDTRFRPDTPEGVRGVLTRVVEATHVTLPRPLPQHGAGMSWEAEESTAIGSSVVRYTRGEGQSVHRERVKYTHITALPSEEGETSSLDSQPQHLTGGATIAVDDSGAITTIEDAESIRIDDAEQPFRARSSFSLTRKSVEPLDPSAVDVKSFTESAKMGRDPKKSDQAVVGTMTADAIGTMVVDYGRGATLPKGFMVRASAYGRLHPESSRELQALFLMPQMTAGGRTLVVDILSSTGDATAQEALSSILRSKEAQADETAFGHWVQRAMLVPRPSRAFAEVVHDLYAHAKQDPKTRHMANAASVPLGSLAKKMVVQGDAELGARIHEELVVDLASARTDDDQVALLKALGNGAFASDDRIIAPYAQSGGSHVREQAAFSLRRIDTDLARKTLLILITDKQPSVAVAAVRTLRRQSMTPEDWGTLSDLVMHDKTAEVTDSAIVTLLGNAESEPGPVMRPLLMKIQGRTHGVDLQEQIKLMLDQDGSPQ